MIKKYHLRDGDEVAKPVAVVVSEGQPDKQNITFEPTVKVYDIKLSNSGILANLNQKLQHLCQPKREDLAAIFQEYSAVFQHSLKNAPATFPDLDMRKTTTHCMF